MFLVLLIVAAAILTGSDTKAMQTAPELRFDADGNLVPVPEGDRLVLEPVIDSGPTPPTSGAPSNGVPSFMHSTGAP